jgi:hypothetical protein
MDRMKSSDEIKERQEGGAVRNWIKRRWEGISMERSGEIHEEERRRKEWTEINIQDMKT